MNFFTYNYNVQTHGCFVVVVVVVIVDSLALPNHLAVVDELLVLAQAGHLAVVDDLLVLAKLVTLLGLWTSSASSSRIKNQSSP